jgi:DNA/RNA endonuclease YhcR with UshA esterase domain
MSKENKIIIAIITSAFIIGGFIYLSKITSTVPSTTERTSQPSISQQQNEGFEKPSGPCIDFKEAKKYIGENKCVTGKVDNVYISRKGNIFLNFCPDYRTCPFSSVIFSSDSYKFSDPKQYKGKVVEISGLIRTYQGRAQIILHDPNQIKIK